MKITALTLLTMNKMNTVNTPYIRAREATFFYKNHYFRDFCKILRFPNQHFVFLHREFVPHARIPYI